ncbi:MAG TPA: response regulator transcription factor [Acidimicrobiales bacterium]|nr:response regulator transcription factor [Acidimicrobiales bacterium]
MQINICDGHSMFSEALSSLLAKRGHRVLARISAPDEAFDIPGAEEADVWLTELEFPGCDGAAAVRRLRSSTPGIPIVVFTSRNDLTALSEVLEAGADGVALKSEGIDEVERLLRRVCALPVRTPNGPTADKAWSQRARTSPKRQGKRSSTQALTGKEREVMSHLARGESTAAVAGELGIRVSTVRTHLQHLYVKLDVHSRLELVAFGVRHGMVRVDGASEVMSA